MAGVRTVYDGSEGKILVPETEAASCFLGQGTRWCTAAREDNAFDEHNSDGPLYVLLPAGAVDPNGRQEKFQLHLPSSQLMDTSDREVSRDTIAGRFPELWGQLQSALTEEEKLDAVGFDGMALAFIDDASGAVQYDAVCDEGGALAYCRDPAPEFLERAVRRSPSAIEFCPSPSQHLQLLAVNGDGTALVYLKDLPPSDEVEWAAVRNNGFAAPVLPQSLPRTAA